METGTILDITRLIVGATILLYASYTDIKTRMASDILWVIIGFTGVVLLVIQYFTIGFGDKTLYLIFIPIMIGLMYVFFQMRLIFGGADAKAIMSLAILTPLEPAILDFPLLNGSPMPFSWTIFSNSILSFLIIPLALIIFNIAKKNAKFPYCVIGYKMNVKKAKEKFVWPMEKIVNGKRKFSYMPKDYDAEDEFDKLEKKGIKQIWVTPKIPTLPLLLFGFICSFVVGDLLFNLIGYLNFM